MEMMTAGLFFVAGGCLFIVRAWARSVVEKRAARRLASYFKASICSSCASTAVSLLLIWASRMIGGDPMASAAISIVLLVWGIQLVVGLVDALRSAWEVSRSAPARWISFLTGASWRGAIQAGGVPLGLLFLSWLILGKLSGLTLTTQGSGLTVAAFFHWLKANLAARFRV